MERKFALTMMDQLFPVYLSLMPGDIYTMHLIATRNTDTVSASSGTRFPAIGIRKNKKIVESRGKKQHHYHSQAVAQPVGHGTTSCRLFLPASCSAPGNRSAGNICFSGYCHLYTQEFINYPIKGSAVSTTQIYRKGSLSCVVLTAPYENLRFTNLRFTIWNSLRLELIIHQNKPEIHTIVQTKHVCK